MAVKKVQRDRRTATEISNEVLILKLVKGHVSCYGLR